MRSYLEACIICGFIPPGVATHDNPRPDLPRRIPQYGECGSCEQREPLNINDYLCIWCRAELTGTSIPASISGYE